MDHELYQELILEHYRAPRNAGRLDAPDFSAKEYNPSCGDACELFLKMEDGRVAEAKHDSAGCAVSMASVSMLTEELKGKSAEDLRALTKEDVLGMLGISVGTMRLRCALLPLETLRKALNAK